MRGERPNPRRLAAGHRAKEQCVLGKSTASIARASLVLTDYLRFANHSARICASRDGGGRGLPSFGSRDPSVGCSANDAAGLRDLPCDSVTLTLMEPVALYETTVAEREHG